MKQKPFRPYYLRLSADERRAVDRTISDAVANFQRHRLGKVDPDTAKAAAAAEALAIWFLEFRDLIPTNR